MVSCDIVDVCGGILLWYGCGDVVDCGIVRGCFHMYFFDDFLSSESNFESYGDVLGNISKTKRIVIVLLNDLRELAVFVWHHKNLCSVCISKVLFSSTGETSYIKSDTISFISYVLVVLFLNSKKVSIDMCDSSEVIQLPASSLPP